MAKTDDIIDIRHFIEATRDSGYKSTTSAIAELVDNSIQAGAETINIDIEGSDDPAYPISVCVADDGVGMATADLRRALQFGGSSRFGNREGLGRYGMGLPNASLSQCRRVEVISWSSRRNPLSCWIDVDEIISGHMTKLPRPERTQIPERCGSASGTVVSWTRCDRLDNARISTIERKVTAAVGRMFRHFIWGGIDIRVNGDRVAGLDPLYLHPDAPITGGVLYGDTRTIRVRPTPESSQPAEVTFRFSRLPVHEWASLSNEHKRSMGISNGAGVSVVRGGREIEYGWHFLGGKRRENYDDWWRCEVAFDPCLDEAFGITHTKQQIRPSDHLLSAISPEIEMIAKELNAAVRQDFQSIKSTETRRPLEQSLVTIEPKLPPLGKRRMDTSAEADLSELRRRHAQLRSDPPARNGRVAEYRLVEDNRTTRALFDVHLDEGRVVVVLNKRHPFFKKAMSNPSETEQMPLSEVRVLVEQIILSAARAEIAMHKNADVQTLRAFRESWGQTLALLAHE